MWANSPQFVRQELWKRDRGVCAKCGVNAERLQERAEVAASSWGWHAKHGMDARVESFRRRNRGVWNVPKFLLGDRWSYLQPRVQEAIAKRLLAMGRAGWNVHRRSSWWESDHIVPVVEGGGQCGAENYRTLCYRCHGSETAQLRKRLAEARRNENRKGTR